MKLFYMPGACSLTDHIALEWVGAPYTAQAVAREDLKKPEFLALNPLGSVPCLLDGDFALTQNTAILEYLNDTFPEANLLGSQDIRAKAEARRWLAFCNADLHKAFLPLFAPMALSDDTATHEGLQNKARANIQRLLTVVDGVLRDRDYLSGYKSVADAYLFVILRWCAGLNIDRAPFPALDAFFARMAADQGVQAAMQAEGLG